MPFFITRKLPIEGMILTFCWHPLLDGDIEDYMKNPEYVVQHIPEPVPSFYPPKRGNYSVSSQKQTIQDETKEHGQEPGETTGDNKETVS